jgi:hypothetical protein
MSILWHTNQFDKNVAWIHLLRLRGRSILRKIWISERKKMIEEYLQKKNIQLNNKGQRWVENIEGFCGIAFIILCFLAVGYVEGAKW